MDTGKAIWNIDRNIYFQTIILTIEVFLKCRRKNGDIEHEWKSYLNSDVLPVLIFLSNEDTKANAENPWLKN